MADFSKLYAINVNDKTEKKGGLTYLSWAWAWAELKKVYPDANYSFYRNANGFPYVYDPNTGYMVYVSVTAGGITHEQWLPVMDARNKAMMTCTMVDINKTLMRCLCKAIAMHGIGLYIYAGEDLPEDEQAAQDPQQAPQEPQEKPKKISKATAAGLMTKCETESVDWRAVCEQMKVKNLVDLTEEQHEYVLSRWEKVKEKCRKV